MSSMFWAKVASRLQGETMGGNTRRAMSRGLQPLTEGYQPGSQMKLKGFAPISTGATPASPPRGGSSVTKPVLAAAEAARSKA
jgi:hypothetical protein